MLAKWVGWMGDGDGGYGGIRRLRRKYDKGVALVVSEMSAEHKITKMEICLNPTQNTVTVDWV